MEPLELLRSKIDDFPGYDTAIERRRSDEFVRSYMGEALTEMAARCTLSEEDQTRLDALVLRVAFADPRDFSVHDALAGPNDGGAVAAVDADTLEAAERANALDCGAVASYLDDVTAVLDRRDSTMRAAVKLP